jgi:hypothetical protein
VLFTFAPARALFGLPEFQPATYDAKIWIGGVEQREIPAIQNRFGGKGFAVGAFETRSFVQLIAKIAHSHAVALLGVDSLEPLLLDVILGRSHSVGHLVGGTMSDEPAEPLLHSVHLEERIVESERLLISFVRLFANLGAPRYHAVVGRLPLNAPPLRPFLPQQQPSPINEKIHAHDQIDGSIRDHPTDQDAPFFRKEPFLSQ